MSLNGTAPPPTVRPLALATVVASAVHGANTAESEGLNPDGRKKLNCGAGTNAPAGPAPQLATCKGNAVGAIAPAATAFSQFDTSNSEFTVFALMGRFKCRPPLKLYPTFKLRSLLNSCSNCRFACCEYAYWKLLETGKPKG